MTAVVAYLNICMDSGRACIYPRQDIFIRPLVRRLIFCDALLNFTGSRGALQALTSRLRPSPSITKTITIVNTMTHL